MAHDVFISYSSQDKPVADAICAALEASRIRCWIAPRDVPPSMLYAAALVNAISQSRLMVLVFSSKSNNSAQVIREVDRAVHRCIPILPFRIEDTPLSESMEYYISTPHWFDAISPPLEKHIQELSDWVRRLLLTDTRQVGSHANHSDPTVVQLNSHTQAEQPPHDPQAEPTNVANVEEAIGSSSPGESVGEVAQVAKPTVSVKPVAPAPATTDSSLPKEIVNSIGMKLVLIPAGEFLMGSSDSDEMAEKNEKPQHLVRITKPFYLGVTPVTWEEYGRLIEVDPAGEDLSHQNPGEILDKPLRHKHLR